MAWMKPMEIENVPSRFQLNLNKICVDHKGVTYPPHQGTELHLEEYIHKYVSEKLVNNRLISDYNYLPVYWTSLAVNKDPKLMLQLKTYIDQVMKKNPTQKFWTVVQHCKGIQGSCGIVLDPHRVKIFGTSKPTSNSQSILAPLLSGGKTTQYQNQQTKHEVLSVIIPLLSASHINAKKENTKNINNISERPILASFIGNLNTHQLRHKMHSVLKKQPDVVIESGNYKESDDKDRFEELMSKTVFALCPRGVGSTSFRLAEAMEYGCIPVYISDTFSLPFDKKINWDNIIIKVLPNEINGLYSILKNKASQPQWLLQRQQNINKIYNEYFKMDKTAEMILSYIVKDI
jgi:hypothetical protein